MAARAVVPPPPPGFEIVNGEMPPPPPGFVVDKPESWIESKTRNTISGANRAIAAPGDIGIAGINAMVRARMKARGAPGPYPQLGNTSEALSSIGVDMDRPRDFFGMLGEYSAFGPATGAKRPASELLTILASTAGGRAANLAFPDSPTAEFLGAISPFGMAPALSGLTRSVFGGGTQKMRDRIADMDAVGVPLTVGSASGEGRAQALENTIAILPGGHGQVRAVGMESNKALEARLRALSGGEITDTVVGGQAIKGGLFDDGGWLSRWRGNRNKLYDKLDTKIDQHEWWKRRGDPEPYAGTVAGSPERQADWPLGEWTDDAAPVVRSPFDTAGAANAPRIWEGKSPFPINVDDGLTGWASAGVRGTTGANRRQMLTGRTPENIPTSPDVSLPAKAAASGGVPSGYQPLHTKQWFLGSNQGVAGAPALSKRQFIDKEIQEMSEDFMSDISNTGRLPYDAIKKLRTKVGDKLDDPELIGTESRKLYGELYEALSKDMEAAATEAGALAEFKAANRYNALGRKRIDDFFQSISNKTTPEEVYSLAIGKSPESATKLFKIKNSLKPDEWAIVRQVVLNRAGKINPSKETQGVAFSAETLFTNYNKWQPRVKDAILGTQQSQFRRDFDQVARVASYLRESSQVLANPSGTAGLGLQGSVTFGAMGGLGNAAIATVMGSAAAPAILPGMVSGIAIGVAGSAGFGKLLTNEQFVRWLAQSTTIPAKQIPGHMARLAVISQTNPELSADIEAYRTNLESQMQ